MYRMTKDMENGRNLSRCTLTSVEVQCTV